MRESRGTLPQGLGRDTDMRPLLIRGEDQIWTVWKFTLQDSQVVKGIGATLPTLTMYNVVF